MSDQPPIVVATTNALPLRIEFRPVPMTREYAARATEVWRSWGLPGRFGIDGRWRWG